MMQWSLYNTEETGGYLMLKEDFSTCWGNSLCSNCFKGNDYLRLVSWHNILGNSNCNFRIFHTQGSYIQPYSEIYSVFTGWNIVIVVCYTERERERHKKRSRSGSLGRSDKHRSWSKDRGSRSREKRSRSRDRKSRDRRSSSRDHKKHRSAGEAAAPACSLLQSTDLTAALGRLLLWKYCPKFFLSHFSCYLSFHLIQPFSEANEEEKDVQILGCTASWLWTHHTNAI